MDVKDAVQAMVTADQKVSLTFDETTAASLLGGKSGAAISSQPKTLVVIYSYGDFHAATAVSAPTIADKTPVEIYARQLPAAEQSRGVFPESVCQSGRRNQPRR